MEVTENDMVGKSKCLVRGKNRVTLNGIWLVDAVLFQQGSQSHVVRELLIPLY